MENLENNIFVDNFVNENLVNATIRQQAKADNMGLAKAGQKCFIELWNVYWGNVLNLGFCATVSPPSPSLFR